MHTHCLGGLRPLRRLSALVALLLASMLSAEPAQGTVPYPDEIAMRFEANHGQFETGVDYASRGQGYQVYLTRPGAVIVLQTTTPRQDTLSRGPKVQAEE